MLITIAVDVGFVAVVGAVIVGAVALEREGIAAFFLLERELMLVDEKADGQNDGDRNATHPLTGQDGVEHEEQREAEQPVFILRTSQSK